MLEQRAQPCACRLAILRLGPVFPAVDQQYVIRNHPVSREIA